MTKAPPLLPPPPPPPLRAASPLEQGEAPPPPQRRLAAPPPRRLPLAPVPRPLLRAAQTEFGAAKPLPLPPPRPPPLPLAASAAAAAALPPLRHSNVWRLRGSSRQRRRTGRGASGFGGFGGGAAAAPAKPRLQARRLWRRRCRGASPGSGFRLWRLWRRRAAAPAPAAARLRLWRLWRRRCARRPPRQRLQALAALAAARLGGATPRLGAATSGFPARLWRWRGRVDSGCRHADLRLWRRARRRRRPPLQQARKSPVQSVITGTRSTLPPLALTSPGQRRRNCVEEYFSRMVPHPPSNPARPRRGGDGGRD